jgi:magnesium-transporting ATPase (P-type)
MTGLLVSFLIRTKNWFFLSQPSKSFVIASLFGLALTLTFVFLSPFKNIFLFSSLNPQLLAYAFLLMFVFVLGTESVKKLFYKKFPDII